ncbi:MAG: hypothetical protein SR1Q7_01330, partial [Quinella sp. 1Q7]|nr:hypothetical protein [Quinella sp. 1Q7]
LICRENFSTLDLPIKSEVAALNDFAKKFNIVQVVAGDPLNLNVPAVEEWLKVCGLPVQVLENDSAQEVAEVQDTVTAARQKFTKNILVVSPLDDGAKAFLIDHFAQTIPNGTLYFLRLNDKGELICRENFSTLDLPIKSEVAALNDFAKKFNIVQVVAGDPLNLNSPAVAEWLKVCGLPVQVLAQS